MTQWKKSEREIFRDIMKTDVFVKILSDEQSQEEMDYDVDQAFKMFRDFERKMSRFAPESELSQLNRSEEMIVSEELFDLLERCKKYHRETEGLFDPAVLPDLKREGYELSIDDDRFGMNGSEGINKYVFSDIFLDEKTRSIQKPLELEIDLGGIGKGYIVDKVAGILAEKYANLFVCAGGDIRAIGQNQEDGYDFWASDVEDPLGGDKSVATLLLRNNGVATSGVNRRKWGTGEKKKHHLIDPRSKQAAETDLITVTVVAPTTERADVWAKVLCILGIKKGMEYARKKNVSALFVDIFGNVFYTQDMGQYIWEASNI